MASYFVKIWKLWVGACDAINRFFERIFMKWALTASTHPIKIILIGLFFALAFMSGFARFNKQNQTERLYFPETTQSTIDLNRAEKSFPKKSKPDAFVITMADEYSSVLNVKAFQMTLHVHQRLMKETGIGDVCVKVGNPPSCLILGPLELFNYNSSLMTNSTIVPTLLNALNNNNQLMQNGRPASKNLHRVFGNFKYDTSANIIKKADAIKVTYYPHFPETDYTHAKVSKVQQQMINILQNEEQKMKEKNELKIFYVTGRSVDDSINESTAGDLSLAVVSLLLMCSFSVLVLISIKDPAGGHVLAGFVGIGCIILGIGSGFGLVMLTGQYYVSFVGLLPFLVLGVGVDDMFIILDSLDDLPEHIHGNTRLQKALGKVGASITMTTATDVVAFAISASSEIPSVRYFCFYAMTSILFSYLLIMTILVAFLSWDIKRIEKNNWDIIPCKKSPNRIPWKNTLKSVSKKAMIHWTKFLMTLPAKICVIIIALGLLAAGVYGTLNTVEKFDSKQLSPDGHYFIRYLDHKIFHFHVGYDIDIVIDDVTFDYTSKQNQDAFMYLDTICKENKFMKNTTINWMTTLLNSKSYNNSLRFYENLNIFLKQYSMYYADIKFDQNTNKILYSRIICTDKDVDNWSFRKDAMLSIRDDLKTKSKIEDVFPISMNYFYREQLVTVRSETIQNLALCAAAILIITSPYLVHPFVILIVFGGFVSLIFELFALMVIWGVALNSISMIGSIMAIGFAVDYSAHVAHSYLLASGDTPEERMIEAMGSIGASVLMGGITTFLGILVLAFGKSEIFRIFFKIVFGIVGLGLLNGLVFLPVFLAVFVRTKVDITHRLDDVDTKVINEKESVKRNEVKNDVDTKVINEKKNGKKRNEKQKERRNKEKNDVDTVIQNPYSGVEAAYIFTEPPVYIHK